MNLLERIPKNKEDCSSYFRFCVLSSKNPFTENSLEEYKNVRKVSKLMVLDSDSLLFESYLSEFQAYSDLKRKGVAFEGNPAKILSSYSEELKDIFGRDYTLSYKDLQKVKSRVYEKTEKMLWDIVEVPEPKLRDVSYSHDFGNSFG
jgi:hypothetical protein